MDSDTPDKSRAVASTRKGDALIACGVGLVCALAIGATFGDVCVDFDGSSCTESVWSWSMFALGFGSGLVVSMGAFYVAIRRWRARYLS